MAITEGPRLPRTGGRARDHAGAQASKARAQELLDQRNAEKRRAGLKDPASVGAEYQQKARGQRFAGPNAFDRLSTERTTE